MIPLLKLTLVSDRFSLFFLFLSQMWVSFFGENKKQKTKKKTNK